MRPVICMITAPLESGSDTRPLVDRMAAAAHAGVHLIQIRQPSLEGRALCALVTAARRAVERTQTRILVNDRLDVALEAGAHGVHLRGDSMAGARVRPVVPGSFLLGRSVHGVEEAVEVSEGDGLNYLVFGAVFPPHSKPAFRVAGIEMLGAVCGRVALPVLAVGGMTVDRLRATAGAGAAGFAAIGMFADTPIDALDALVARAARVFDTPNCLP